MMRLREGKWRASDSTKNWDSENASRIIAILSVTRIKDFVSPPPVGKEVFTLSLGDEKNATKVHYRFYSIKDRIYALNLNEKLNEAYLLEDSMLAALPKTENEWKIIPQKK